MTLLKGVLLTGKRLESIGLSQRLRIGGESLKVNFQAEQVHVGTQCQIAAENCYASLGPWTAVGNIGLATSTQPIVAEAAAVQVALIAAQPLRIWRIERHGIGRHDLELHSSLSLSLVIAKCPRFVPAYTSLLSHSITSIQITNHADLEAVDSRLHEVAASQGEIH